jgi:hypothetical protein
MHLIRKIVTPSILWGFKPQIEGKSRVKRAVMLRLSHHVALRITGKRVYLGHKHCDRSTQAYFAFYFSGDLFKVSPAWHMVLSVVNTARSARPRRRHATTQHLSISSLGTKPMLALGSTLRLCWIKLKPLVVIRNDAGIAALQAERSWFMTRMVLSYRDLVC